MRNNIPCLQSTRAVNDQNWNAGRLSFNTGPKVAKGKKSTNGSVLRLYQVIDAAVEIREP